MHGQDENSYVIGRWVAGIVGAASVIGGIMGLIDAISEGSVLGVLALAGGAFGLLGAMAAWAIFDISDNVERQLLERRQAETDAKRANEKEKAAAAGRS